MEIIRDKNKNIYSIRKSIVNDKVVLNWESIGHSKYLILFTDEKNKIDIISYGTESLLFKKLNIQIDKLIENESLYMKEENIYCYLFSLEQLRRDGGFKIKNLPGFYAIFGIEISDKIINLYLPPNVDSTNLFTMSIDVLISDEPIYEEKRKLFRKEHVYSGYHRVILNNKYPNLIGGMLKYSILEYTYSFPDEIVKNGGQFLVKVPLNNDIRFYSTNKGIIIR